MKLQIVQLSRCSPANNVSIRKYISLFPSRLNWSTQLLVHENRNKRKREKKKKEREGKRNKRNERSLSTFSRWNQRDGLVKADKTNLPPRSEIFSIAPINRKFTFFASTIKIFPSIVYRSIRSTRNSGTFFYTNNFTDQMAKCVIPVTNCTNTYYKFQYMRVLC